MKKIAFFVQHMLCGGVENALISLTDKLNNDGNDVYIYVIVKRGEFISRIPNGVTLREMSIPEKIRKILPVGGTKLTVRENLKGHHYISAAINLKNRYFGKTEFAELNVDFDQIPSIEEPFDIAVNFHMHSPFLVRFLSEKVKAERKYAWIHNDFTTTGYNIKVLKKYLECCDQFFGVSQRVVDEFVEIFPEYKSKTQLALNIVPVEAIKKKAEEFYPKEYEEVPDGVLKILSVGRLEEQKGYDLTIEVCKKLVDDGLEFRWFILGEGSERRKLEKSIRKYKLEKILLMPGIKENPYPYFKYCDIYVQTSRHEGYVTTVTEAKIFNRPIVCTDVSGAREQLEDGITGKVVVIDVLDIFRCVKELLKSGNTRNKYSLALSKRENIKVNSWISNFV